MDLRYEHYCLAGQDFYDIRSRSDASDGYSRILSPLSTDWSQESRDVWRVLTPLGHRLRAQGWKIHVSATPNNAQRVLTIVASYCVQVRIPFKHLVSPSIVLSRNSKSAPRSASGKLVTIYPDDDVHFEQILVDLSDALVGEPGPYILSDLRIGAGPLYVRYGGFLMRWVEVDGRRVPAVQRPDGSLEPDQRRPGLYIPDWVEIPACLHPHLAARKSNGPTRFPYQIVNSLHYSNGGGVYLAHPGDDDTHLVVLKEARPHAGLDREGTDAVSRLAREHDTLTRLAGIDGIPQVLRRFIVWEHHYLAIEHRPGLPLGGWMARNYPLMRVHITDHDIADYTRRAVQIGDRVERMLQEIHTRGMVFGDLHVRNILVADDSVSLIDFEAAFPTSEHGRPALGVPGFRPPAGCTGIAVDQHALAVLRLWLFLPLTILLELAPAKVNQYLDYIEQRFPLPAGYTAAIRATLTSQTTTMDNATCATLACETMWSDEEPSQISKGIIIAILASATPERKDRLFPGDIEQFSVGGTCFGYGASGVLYALEVSGAGRFPQHEQWLLDNLARTSPQRPGFYDGAHGIAYVLEHFGYTEQATALIDRAAPIVEAITNHDVNAGLAGIGLNLLHFGVIREDSLLLAQALSIGQRLSAMLPAAAPPGAEGRAGLCHGWSGPALLFIQLYEQTSDSYWLNLADQAIGRDLQECVDLADYDKLQVRDGSRSLPYVAVGSAGIAIVAGRLFDHRPAAECLRQFPQLLRSCCGEFIVQPGMMLGRAGLLATLAQLRRRSQDPIVEQAIKRHVNRLRLHALPYGGGIAFPGNQLMRLSMDLNTGGAGVLLALASVADDRVGLPFLTRDLATR